MVLFLWECVVAGWELGVRDVVAVASRGVGGFLRPLLRSLLRCIRRLARQLCSSRVNLCALHLGGKVAFLPLPTTTLTPVSSHELISWPTCFFPGVGLHPSSTLFPGVLSFISNNQL